MSRPEIPDVFEPLRTGENIFCTCGHHLNRHKTEALNDDFIPNICSFDNSHYVCPCTGFESQSKRLVKLIDTSGINTAVMETEKQ